MTVSIRRRGLVRAAMALPLVFPLGSRASTDFPSKTIRLIVPYTPGSAGDIMARMVSQPLQAELNVAVIVENRPGAGGVTGTEFVASAPPDGYVLCVGSISNMLTATLASSLARYKTQDFKGVGRLANLHMVITTTNAPGAPATLQELTTRLKAGDGNFAASGVGTIVHLTGLRYMQAAGVNATHISYPGSVQTLTDVAAGHVLFASESIPASLPLIHGGKLRALAVTSPQRHPFLSGVPTVAESGFAGFEVQSWNGIWAPPGTPSTVVARLNKALVKVISDEGLRKRIVDMGLTPATPVSSEEMDKFVLSEIPLWNDVVQKANLKKS